jgi:16S rRNA (guanine(966)-N(2))-methyltransferase RsmD
MRIISGKYKARRINPPKNLPVRPTTDMSKESLFNILNNYFNFNELSVLDLFSGTGNISYEFASRGSSPIVCVDGNANCVNFIKKTTKEFDFDITSIHNDVFKFLEKHTGCYDLIFADPPYDMAQKDFEFLVLQIFEKQLLQPEGMLIVEHSKHTPIDHLPHFSFDKKYGASVFSFFEIENDDLEEEL